jgi:UrcA family protein
LRLPASLEAFEIKGEFTMSTFRFASVSGFIGAAVLAAAIAPVATSAFAAPTDDQATVYVWTKDLNMFSEAGAREALSRIQWAADGVCGGVNDDGLTMEQRKEWQECAQAVVKRTVASMNLPTLTAVSQGRHVSALASADH